MSEQRLPRHGRNHRAAGSDPIWPGDPLFFNVDNEGGYLYVQTNDCVDLDTLPDPLAVGSNWGAAIEDDSGCGLVMGSTDQMLLLVNGGGALNVLSDGGDVVVTGSTVIVSLPASGNVYVVNDHLGNPLVTYTG